MADQDPGTASPAEPTGSAEERLAALQTLENGEATKQSRMKWVDGANYGMLGADLGYGAYAASSAALGAGATGAAAAGAAALAAVPAVVALGGAWVLGKIGVTSKLEEGFEWVGDQLGLTIGRGDPHPACVGDDIAHSSGFWGMVAGLAVGVAIGAMVAATVATGGLAGAVLVGACMAGGLSLGGALASASQNMGSNCGKISTGSGNVTFEGKAAARVTDLVACTKHPGPEPLVEGSKTITVNGLPIVRIGHSTHCSGKVNSGRKSIWIDKTTGQYGPKNPELTAGEEFLALPAIPLLPAIPPLPPMPLLPAIPPLPPMPLLPVMPLLPAMPLPPAAPLLLAIPLPVHSERRRSASSGRAARPAMPLPPAARLPDRRGWCAAPQGRGPR